MPRAKTSPHYQYSQPLLAAMHLLTGGNPNTRVRHIDATAKMCEMLGITLDAHGTQAGTNQFWTVRWASLAMLDHKNAGLMDYPSKGWWILTPAGVAAAAAVPVKAILDAADAVVAPKVEVVVEAVAAPAEVLIAKPVNVELPTVPEPQAVEAFVATAGPALADLDAILPPSVEQAVDAYFLGLQMAATPCFSQWSGRSDSCKTCPLAGKCYDALLAKMAVMADDLTREENKPAPIMVTSTAGTPDLKMPASAATAALKNPMKADKPTDLGLDLDSTPAVKPKAGSFNVAGMIEMVAAGEAKCACCGGVIAQGEKAAYSRKSGFAHISCANKSAGVAP